MLLGQLVQLISCRVESRGEETGEEAGNPRKQILFFIPASGESKISYSLPPRAI